ncbi:MAG: hypothetical protein PHD02_03920 [Bacilli bacterium]|nr:hypothetical protein [Bacilli bacterium]
MANIEYDEVTAKRRKIINHAMEPIDNAVEILQESICTMYFKSRIHIVGIDRTSWNKRYKGELDFLEAIYQINKEKRNILYKIISECDVSPFDIEEFTTLSLEQLKYIYDCRFSNKKEASKILLFKSPSKRQINQCSK